MAKELLQTRVELDDLKAFRGKCEALGVDHNDMIREIVNAFGEGRVTITPTETQLKKRKELYND